MFARKRRTEAAVGGSFFGRDSPPLNRARLVARRGTDFISYSPQQNLEQVLSTDSTALDWDWDLGLGHTIQVHPNARNITPGPGLDAAHCIALHLVHGILQCSLGWHRSLSVQFDRYLGSPCHSLLTVVIMCIHVKYLLYFLCLSSEYTAITSSFLWDPPFCRACLHILNSLCPTFLALPLLRRLDSLCTEPPLSRDTQQRLSTDAQHSETAHKRIGE